MAVKAAKFAKSLAPGRHFYEAYTSDRISVQPQERLIVNFAFACAVHSLILNSCVKFNMKIFFFKSFQNISHGLLFSPV